MMKKLYLLIVITALSIFIASAATNTSLDKNNVPLSSAADMQ